VTSETLPAVAGDDGEHVPGYCADHPTQRLITHRAAGLRWYGEDPATVCQGDHPADEADRCLWCGGPLYTDPTPYWRRRTRRAFCSSADRLRAHRAAKR